MHRLQHRLQPGAHFIGREEIAAARIDERRRREGPAPRDEFSFDNGIAANPAAVAAPTMLVSLRQIFSGEREMLNRQQRHAPQRHFTAVEIG